MNPILALIYWSAIVQYITRHLPQTSGLYRGNHPDPKCPLLFIAQLSFWVGLGWAVYFSLSDPSSSFLFALTVFQMTVTFGRLYEIRKSGQVLLNYDTFLFHWVGLPLALYYFWHRGVYRPIPNLKLTIALILLYLVVYLGYGLGHKKLETGNPKCQPEPFFSMFKDSERRHLLAVGLYSLALAVLLNGVLALK